MKENKKAKTDNKVPNEIIKQIFINILIANILMIIFFIIMFLYNEVTFEKLELSIQTFSGIFLLLGLINMEKSYKTDSNAKLIRAIEFFTISIYTLSIMHIIKKYQYDFQIYTAASSYIFAIYYVLKSIIIYTNCKRKMLENISDIKSIVQKEEPVKKEATKRTKKEEPVKKEKTKKEEITKKETIKKVEKEGTPKKKTSKKTEKETTIKKEPIKKKTSTNSKKAETVKTKKTTTKKKKEVK